MVVSILPGATDARHNTPARRRNFPWRNALPDVPRRPGQRRWLPQGARTLLALVSVLPLVVAALFFGRMLRRDLDEMLQRIVLEGMAIGLIVYVPLSALYTNLRTAGAYVPRLDPPDLLFAPALLVAVGIAVAARRFR
jgi:hypothetical protein